VSIKSYEDIILGFKKTTLDFLENIVENISESIIVTDLDGKIIFFNKGSEKLFNYSSKEMTGKHIITLGAKKPNVLAEIRKGKTFRGEIQLKRGDEIFPAYVICIPLRDEHENPIALVGLAKDLTEEKRKEMEVRLLKERLRAFSTFNNIIGVSSEMLNIFKLIEKISPTDCNVLIQGETGTGKNLIAQAIHANSLRKQNSYIVVDCASLNENLLETELFGHTKGAYTGALTDKKGYFEIANKGTLLLDEISELSLRAQAKLLRMVQENKIIPVGSTKSIKTDVRILAATNQDLDAMVKEGKFRKDLFYRLNVIRLNIPPLRERLDDIVPLSTYFLDIYKRRFKKTNLRFDNKVLTLFKKYDWPGNIRELENVILHTVITTQGESITIQDLPEKLKNFSCLRKFRGSETKELDFASSKKKILDSFLKQFITDALRQNDGNISKTAKEINLRRTSLQRIIKRYNINIKDLS